MNQEVISALSLNYLAASVFLSENVIEMSQAEDAATFNNPDGNLWVHVIEKLGNGYSGRP